MDVSRDDQRDSWIPRTPLLKSQVIYTNRQGNQIDQDQVNRLGSKGFSLDFPHETRDRTLGACLDSVNGNREAALEAKKGITGDSAELCSEFHNSAIGWSFTSLLAQQDPASAASTSRATYGIGDFMLGSNTQWSANFEWRSQQNLPIPHGPVHDLYLPPEETVNSISSQITCQITPVTPEKAARTECRQVAQMQNLCTNGKAIQEISEVDTNRLQTDTELQKVARNSSFATVSTARTENGNPGQYGANDISLGETPQQKTRRKKHRPKVITEGKPRTRKPVTPKPAPCTESPTGKRKYVRKKPPDKAPRTPPAESNETPTGKRKYVRKKLLNQVSTPEIETAGDPTSPQAPKPANKSCRRSLNFDIEEQALNDNCNCKPNSNGDSQPQAEDVCGGSQSKKSTVTLGQGIEVMVETTQAGIRHDFTHSLYQMLQEYNSLPEKQTPKAPQPAKNCPPKRKWNDNCQENHEKWGDRMANHYVQQNTTQITLRTDTQFPPVPTNASNWNPCTTKIEEEQENKSKWYNSIHQPSICSANLAGIYYNAMPAYEIESLVKIPSVARKKRTVKGQNSTTSSTSSMTAAKDMVGQEMTGALGGTGRLQYKMQSPGFILTQMKRSTRKRSRGPTQSQDLDALTKIARGERHPIYTARQAPKSYNEQQVGDLNRPHACVEALAAESHKTLTTKKRTKKIVSLVNSVSSITNDELSYGKIILYNQNEYSPELIGPRPDIMQKEMSSIDVLAEQLQHLDINRDGNALVSHSIGNEQQNALVLYREDGTIVPFTGVFKPIKKRRPRPKVDLDEETNRVWKLLLGNINSEGIDGTNEEKAKWWKEEREVFRGRANSFIARMHLVQGDRRFSQWKGSVVDSVIGVFLTQNVSDHLSSSAFMSLTAQFPLKSPFCGKIKDSVIEKPIVCMPDLEDVVKWNEMSNHSICDQSSMTFHDYELDEEREVVYSNESPTSSTGIVSSRGVLETYCESTENRTTAEIIKTVDTCYMEEKRSTPNDASSSQNSAVSSQNSADSPVAQTDERKESFSENNSEEEDQTDRSKPKRLNSSSSFMELLIKAGSNKLHEVLSHRTVLSDQNSINECKKAESVENNSHIEKMYIVDSSKSSLEVFVAQSPSNDCHSHVTSELKGLKVEDFKMITEERGYSDISKNNGRNHKQEQSSFTAEYASHIIDENNQDNSSHEASRYPTANNQPFSNNQEGKHLAIQSQGAFAKGLNIVEKLQTLIENNELQQNLNLPNLLGKTQDFVERSSGLNNKEKNLQKTIESDLLEHGLSEIKEHNTMNDAKRKAKSRRVGKEIRDDIDWDALRRQAEANGRKRERTPNTMDSLDWEAVRCADVNEIANTIKERGMNNMLAERIKDFLNRLVREHGSIDLEWLRDVPPDKAKEYLLSIRGLGLKSVECVRLLTLHHLAFPVDTNVGRIAVRLGWVPLQPLPESLQLHLLELYPVLESIQQYLWPRLCKLDQRTLYELHYQMITFGKVFCTKNKPNCNACPMRGECRHFASAFASARLALPGPEEKGIVRTTENRRNEPMPAVMVDQLPLPPPQATEQSEKHQQLELERQPEARYGVRNCEPIVEEPSSPEPECTQVTEHDMEDTFSEDPDEIPTIKLNIEEFTQNLQNYMQENMELQVADMSKALVALTAEAASIPMPKLKNVSRLRTEHQVYELPDSHPLLQGLDRRELDDPCLYLLAIWTPGETANSIQPPESTCNSQEYGKLCDETTCFSCNSIREANSQIVRGTLLIPCRTAMRGSFPLNGTYFQVNEVFADHDSSLNPIDVPRAWIWNLPRRTVYFGTSIPTIFKGLTTEGIQHCFWRGYVCVRGFDQKTRAPRPLMARLHFPASKVNKTRGKGSNE